jgi:alpha-1,3-rhamnosyltransferase
VRELTGPAGDAGTPLPDVSVVVPSYNHAAYLESCLRSILAQSHRPRELVVIDDGSSDGSPVIAERVLRDAPFPAELVVRANRGLGATLNEGLARTRAELFAYLGSDDRWHRDRLRLGAAALGADAGAVVAYGPCYLVDAGGAVVGVSRPRRTVLAGSILPHLLRFHFVPASPTVTFRRSAIERVGWSEDAWLEDYGVYLQLAVAGRFVFVPEPLGYWRWHGANRTWQCERMLADILAAQARHAPALGLTPAGLQAAVQSARFHYAYHFILAGDRRRAARETVLNIRGARSPLDAADRLARVAMPTFVLAWLRRARVRWWALAGAVRAARQAGRWPRSGAARRGPG